MLKSKLKVLTAALLCLAMIGSMININSLTAMALETQDTSLEDLTDESNTEDNIENINEMNASDNTGERLENSWRYENGERIVEEPLISPAAANDFVPWSNTNGKFINDQGEEIKGAIAKGMDISQWQGTIDWNKVKASDIDFAIIRCASRINQVDTKWDKNASESARVGIPFGTYFYAHATTVQEAKQEAQLVLKQIKGYSLDYPVYYDLEDDLLLDLTNAERAAIAKAFCDTIEAAGYPTGIYANKNWFDNYLTDPYFNTRDKWVAQWASKCTYSGTYSMWQCTSSGVVPGITENVVDLDFQFIPATGSKVRDFVTRFYQLTLRREPDEEGLAYWASLLILKKNTGAEVANYFINGKEFEMQQVSNEDYVEVLYQTFFNRAPDASGKSYWMDVLASGVSRNFLLKEFVDSKEFTMICDEYQINKGSITVSEWRDQKLNVTKFINRCYDVFLERQADADGLNYWTSVLIKGEYSPKEVTRQFVFSKEMSMRNLSDDDFIRIMYAGFFGREADSDGYEYWRNEMRKGASRESIFNSFSSSKEFEMILATFDL